MTLVLILPRSVLIPCSFNSLHDYSNAFSERLRAAATYFGNDHQNNVAFPVYLVTILN